MAEVTGKSKTPNLKRWRSREPVDHRPLNETNRAVEAITRGVRPPKQIGLDADGPITIRAGDVARFRLVSVAGDYLVCEPFDGTEPTGPTVFVAKNYILRRNPFDGKSRNGITYNYTSDVSRTASSLGDTEDQVVVDPYVAGDEIWATYAPTGGTGVQAGDETVEWLDDNRDGRAWAHEYGT